MVRFTWKSDGKNYEDLFVGETDVPIGWIRKSSTGKLWTHLIDIPGITQGWRSWIEKDELKAAIEEAVDKWICFACMDRPATDRNDE